MVANIVVVTLAVISLLISQNLRVANFIVVILAVLILVMSQKSEGGQLSSCYTGCFQFGDISKV